MNTRLFLLTFFSTSITATAGDPSLPAVASENSTTVPCIEAVGFTPAIKGWYISAGAMWRQIGDVSFHSGVSAGVSSIPQLKPEFRSKNGTAYHDGYVRPDSSGGSETWNWGYENASQVRGDSLIFQGTRRESFNSQSLRRFDTQGSADLAGAGFFVDFESPSIIRKGSLVVSAHLGYSLVEDTVGHRTMAYQMRQSAGVKETAVTDSYDISAIAPIPAAPYSGTFNGPGPIIGNRPEHLFKDTITRIVEQETYSGEFERNLRVQLHTISLGPRFAFACGNVKVLAGLGVALNIAQWKASSTEELRRGDGRLIGQWDDVESATDVLVGGYAESIVEWQLTQSWAVFVMGRYDGSPGQSRDIRASVFDLDLGGWTAGGGVIYRF